jgi:hypothetical protein
MGWIARGAGARLSVALALTLTLSGCAPLACELVSVTVAEKEEQSRLESRLRGVHIDRSGRVGEEREDVLVQEHWIRDTAGRWHRVSAEQWHGVAVGGDVEVCR